MFPVEETVFVILITVLNVLALSLIKIPLLEIVLGLFTPLIVLSFSIPFSPALPVLLILFGAFNLVEAVREVS